MNIDMSISNNGIRIAMNHRMNILSSWGTTLFHLACSAYCRRKELDTSIVASLFQSNSCIMNSEKCDNNVDYQSDERLNTECSENLYCILDIYSAEDLAYIESEDSAYDTNSIIFDDYKNAGITFKIHDYFGETPSIEEARCCDNEIFKEDAISSLVDRLRSFIHAVYDLLFAPSYRIPKRVRKIRIYPDNCYFGVCPRCNNSLDREYQTFCNCCGQRLDWSKLDAAEEEWIGAVN